VDASAVPFALCFYPRSLGELSHWCSAHDGIRFSGSTEALLSS
jgi:elongation factor P hydroxylase